VDLQHAAADRADAEESDADLAHGRSGMRGATRAAS
jgi:hypothetical protein